MCASDKFAVASVSCYECKSGGCSFPVVGMVLLTGGAILLRHRKPAKSGGNRREVGQALKGLKSSSIRKVESLHEDIGSPGMLAKTTRPHVPSEFASVLATNVTRSVRR